MIGLFNHLENIEQAGGSNAKKELLAQACLVPEYRQIIKMSLDPRYPMYLGREAKFHPIDPEADEYECHNIIIIMENLHEGVISRGALAHKAVNEAIGSFVSHAYDTEKFERAMSDQDYALKWLPRLFTKDLQTGVSWETFTKATDTRKFAVMLAKPLRNIKKIEDKFEFPVYVQPKLDGYRAIANTGGEFELKSRNGNEYENFPQIVEALREICPDYVIPDGEVMSEDFQAMQKTAFRQDGKKIADVKYYIFDAITRDEWDKREGEFTFEERYDSMINLLGSHPLIEIVETYEANSWEEVYDLHDRFMKGGFEGTMVRANKPYFFKRVDFLAKIKEMHTMDCEVIGIEEGRNSLKGSMGHLVVKQENGVECGVGSGFTKEDRKKIFEHQDLYIGDKIEVKYQELTKKEKVMRFPTFVRWRRDK